MKGKKQFFVILLCIAVLACSLCLTICADFSGSDRIVLVLDPGHGGGSIGTAAGGISEKTMTLRLAFLIRDRLEANGSFQVHLTRTGDTDLPLCERAMHADWVNADALISLHFDGSTSSSPRGMTAYTSVFREWALMDLGGAICRNISAATGLPSNGVVQKYDVEGFYWNPEYQWDCKDPSLTMVADHYGIPCWCAKFGVPSMIMEHGYFTNSADRDIIFSEGMLERMADAEAQAIIDYYINHTHSYGARQQDFPSNCMFDGKTSVHCTVCGHRKNVETLPSAPDRHYWEVESRTPASCGKDGVIQYVCRITSNLNKKSYPCEQHTYTEIIPAPSEHQYTLRTSVPATHTRDGYALYACTICGDSFREPYIAAGHSWEYVSYVEPACTEHGGDLYRCSVCSEVYYEGGGALGHAWTVTEYTAPTCAEIGYENKLCERCGENAVAYPAALGHDFGGAEIREEATCIQPGRLQGHCLRCEQDIAETLSCVGHVTETVAITAPGCTESGWILSHCSVCDGDFTEPIEARGHVYLKADGAAASCSGAGYELRCCAVCGSEAKTELPATGHRWSAEEVSQKPGVFCSGIALRTCENGCGEQRERSLLPWIADDGLWLPVVLAVLAWLGVAALLIRKWDVLCRRGMSAEGERKSK